MLSRPESTRLPKDLPRVTLRLVLTSPKSLLFRVAPRSCRVPSFTLGARESRSMVLDEKRPACMLRESQSVGPYLICPVPL
jgi:hypothetical protein